MEESEEAFVLLEEETQKILSMETKETSGSKRSKNMLFNLKVQIEILNIPPFEVNVILDTGATTCCIDEKAVPDAAMEENPYIVHFSGITSKTTANKKLKGGKMTIGDNTFRIPYTYAFTMRLGDDIQMIIGCNFIRAMQGGVRIEGNIVTFYKNLTTVSTLPYIPAAAAIEELDLEEDDYIQIQEAVYFSAEAQQSDSTIRAKFGGLLNQLKAQGYIGEDPLKYWGKNKIQCKLEIKNPDFIVEDKPLKHLTPQAKEAFSKHIRALLEIGVIRPNKSRHRTTAIIVNSGTTIDLTTGMEKKGKERMVAMHPDSIEWTAFWVPDGLYEWLAMPFGLKNAPAIF
ncbi:uncharacterized protein LOC135616362 [Musa acuminata AAA Group]|uniref:uncharacterized protein LOC135616362 n=1 Tax=Musa acuminata AAA Group TaxID=214697 RepID=UPI0031DE906B